MSRKRELFYRTPIYYLEAAVLLCVLSEYKGRKTLPSLAVSISGGKIKILVSDFGAPDEEYGAEFDALKNHCKNCYILKNLKLPWVIGAEKPSNGGDG